MKTFAMPGAVVICGILILLSAMALKSPDVSAQTEKRLSTAEYQQKDFEKTVVTSVDKLLATSRFYFASDSTEVSTGSSTFVPIPGMAIRFKTIASQKVDIRLDAAGTEVFGAEAVQDKAKGFAHFRILVDGVPAARSTYTFRNIREGYDHQICSVVYAGVLAPGEHSVIAEWSQDAPPAARLTTGLNQSNRLLKVWLDNPNPN